MENEFDPKYFVKCSCCDNHTYVYDFKITGTFYGQGLCNSCEMERIKAGFWSDELKMKYINEREKFLHA